MRYSSAAMTRRRDPSDSRLDDAARAGWLYYVAGKTQEDIATTLGVSRQTAQRLVSLAVSEGLIRVRLEHPIADCMDLADQLSARFGLDHAEVVPGDPASTSTTLGIADALAAEIESHLRMQAPKIIAMGTGRTLKAAVDLLPKIDCPQHRVVSLTGNLGPDGSAAYYNVIFKMADSIRARHFPFPLSVFASSSEERDLLHKQPMIQQTLQLAANADVSFVGIGELGPQAPLFLDGFVSEVALRALQDAGAVGEIVGWTFDAKGELIQGLTNDRVASAPIPSRDTGLVIGAAIGARKLPAIRGALANRLVNGIITDELTARALLDTR
jgi:DNA-binding transcriptional regulator LsrR (DeoR family)